jgi:hypothetical protein
MNPVTECALLIAHWCAVCLTGTCDLNLRAEAPKPNPATAAASYEITVSKEKPATIPEEALTVELISVKDNRCAVEVQCVWAGYAELTLRVSKAGGGADTVVVGGLPPSSSSGNAAAANQGSQGRYRFSLVNLEPGKSMAKPVTPANYRATLNVEKH